MSFAVPPKRSHMSLTVKKHPMAFESIDCLGGHLERGVSDFAEVGGHPRKAYIEVQNTVARVNCECHSQVDLVGEFTPIL